MRVKILEKQTVELARVPVTIKAGGDLNPDQQKIHDITKKFAKLTPAKAQSLRKDLNDLNIVRLTENHIVQIIDLLPVEIANLHSILSGSKTTITPENLDKIIGKVKQYAKWNIWG